MGGMERTRPARGSGCGNTTSHCQVLRDSRTERPTAATAPHPFITPLPLLQFEGDGRRRRRHRGSELPRPSFCRAAPLLKGY